MVSRHVEASLHAASVCFKAGLMQSSLIKAGCTSREPTLYSHGLRLQAHFGHLKRVSTDCHNVTQALAGVQQGVQDIQPQRKTALEIIQHKQGQRSCICIHHTRTCWLGKISTTKIPAWPPRCCASTPGHRAASHPAIGCHVHHMPS